MIEAINLQNLRNAEFIQFCKNFTTIVNTSNPTTLSVKPQYDTMMLRLGEMETLFKTATSNPITAEIEALDVRRDRAITGIVEAIKSFSYHFVPEMTESARLLQENLDL